MNLEELKKFGEQYEWIENKGAQFFKRLEELTVKYTDPKKWRPNYHFDNMLIEGDYITLRGSDYDGEKIEYDLSFESFTDFDEYYKRREADLITSEQKRMEKARLDAVNKERQEYEQYLLLSKKYYGRDYS